MVVGTLKWPLAKFIPDLTGKIALVTGANSSKGIGFHTAYQLAAHGAKVYIGARSGQKAEAAIQEMTSSNSSILPNQLHPFVADLGDLNSVDAAAQKFLSEESRLDILIHNAAILSMPLELNSYGISVSITTNHLGSFALTMSLLPLLKKTAEISPGVRVVAVSAPTYKFPPLGIRFDSPASFNIEMEATPFGDAAFTRYGKIKVRICITMIERMEGNEEKGLSKLANLLFMRQLQKNFNKEGIQALSISLHPGLVKTDGTIKMVRPGTEQAFAKRMTPEEGALNTLFAATNPEVWEKREQFGGSYLIPHGKIEQPVGNGANDELAKELWETSEKLVGDILG